MCADSMVGFPLSRRALLGALAATATFPTSRSFASTPQRIASLDYGLASTLLSLDVVPIAVGDLADWGKWVVEPTMPSSVINLGSSYEPNFELLLTMKPDLVLTTPYLDHALPQLQSLFNVLRLEVYKPDGGPILPAAMAATRNLGDAIGRSREAQAFLNETDRFFEDCRKRLATKQTAPVALVNFMDERHVRIYSSPGLYDNVLTRIGVRNAWTEPSNFWGYETLAIEDLSRISDPNALLIAFDPLPGDALPKLAESPLWQALPFSRPDQFTVLPPALMFGMVNEARRFATLLTDYLESRA